MQPGVRAGSTASWKDDLWVLHLVGLPVVMLFFRTSLMPDVAECISA